MRINVDYSDCENGASCSSFEIALVQNNNNHFFGKDPLRGPVVTCHLHRATFIGMMMITMLMRSSADREVTATDGSSAQIGMP
jgi:hypothetical protein